MPPSVVYLVALEDIHVMHVMDVSWMRIMNQQIRKQESFMLEKN